MENQSPRLLQTQLTMVPTQRPQRSVWKRLSCPIALPIAQQVVLQRPTDSRRMTSWLQEPERSL
ncbi:unnamed protein product [Cladocopium goreaui]|uniref:Uncharacterized protein n=1 Tax=Cladocopium goreaui TaxID=2562237 RepID=A0A9P1FQR0_9DINO|nr:unnamed protein product [Cladocopium goreaui]